MNYPIQVIRVKSRNTGKEYFSAYPSADVDYVTDGLLILVSNEKKEIQLHNAAGDEYAEGPYEGGMIRAERENKKQNRLDLRAVSIDLDTQSQPFSIERFAYHDIYDVDGHADATERITTKAFLASGGTITY